MRWLPCMLLAMVAANASAQSAGQPPPAALRPDDFAHQRALQLPAGEGLYRIMLDEAAYSRLHRPDLGDIAAFAPDGRQLPLMPLTALPRDALTEHRPVEAFELPQPAADSDKLSWRIERGSDGRLSRVDTRISAADTERPGGMLVDLGEQHARARGLLFDLDSLQRLNLRVQVEGSDDLDQWRVLAAAAPLLRLGDGGAVLQRNRIALPHGSPRYLRLAPAADGQLPPPAALTAEFEIAEDAVAPAEIEAGFDSGDAQAGYAYRLPGPMPVTAARLQLAATNTVASVRLLSRDQASAPWRERGRALAFALGSGADRIEAEVMPLSASRDRYWRVDSEPPLDAAPDLILQYQPDQLLLAADAGSATLALGSARTRRPAFPLDLALAEVRSRRGGDWQPPLVEPGAESLAAGEAALQPQAAPFPWQRVLLWLVLGGGVLAVVAMVLRLLRPAAPE